MIREHLGGVIERMEKMRDQARVRAETAAAQAQAYAEVIEELRRLDGIALADEVLRGRVQEIDRTEDQAQAEAKATAGVQPVEGGRIRRRLGRLRWLEPLRLACDTSAQLPAIRRAVELLRWHNVTPRRYSCYMLVRDLEDALERVRVLKGLDLDPFAQPFIGPDGAPPARDLLRFARWVNHRAAFKTCTWEDYRAIAGDAIGPHRLPVQNRSQLGLALGGDA